VTGLCYYGYRYYDPVTGRWLSRDPIQERRGLNIYGVMRNDVVNGIDLLGMSPSGSSVVHTYNALVEVDELLSKVITGNSSGMAGAIRILHGKYRDSDVESVFGDGGFYSPFFKKITLESTSRTDTVIYELVHSNNWYPSKFNGLSDRKAEGMLCGFKAMYLISKEIYKSVQIPPETKNPDNTEKIL